MPHNTLEKLYQDTLNKLKMGHRPQIKLTPELTSLLKSQWAQKSKEALCVLNHTQNPSNEFNELIIKSLEISRDVNEIIYLLGVAQNQLIAHSQKSGEMFPQEFFLVLKKLLQNKNPEILEWTLRTIESMGPLNLRLKKEILEIKPGFKKFFNSHLKASDEIINLLIKQWGVY